MKWLVLYRQETQHNAEVIIKNCNKGSKILRKSYLQSKNKWGEKNIKNYFINGLMILKYWFIMKKI